MTRIVPLDKRSKKAQREYHAKQRGSWYGIRPDSKRCDPIQSLLCDISVTNLRSILPFSGISVILLYQTRREAIAIYRSQGSLTASFSAMCASGTRSGFVQR